MRELSLQARRGLLPGVLLDDDSVPAGDMSVYLRPDGPADEPLSVPALDCQARSKSGLGGKATNLE